MSINYASTVGIVEEIFDAHKGRRHGMLRALTTERDDFYRQCDPECENLGLYSFPDGTWKVSKPVDEIPAALPEPCLGINFARDGMYRKDWFALVSAHSDSWLLAVTFFDAAKLYKEQRAELFDLISELPTVFEVVTGQAFMTQMEAPPAGALRQVNVEEDNADQEDQDGEDEAYCGACRGSSKSKFWIFCETCRQWFHGKCVKITQAMADRIDSYKCPACEKKWPRP